MLVTGKERVAHFKVVLNQPEHQTCVFRNEGEESVLEVYMGDITLDETDRAIKTLKGGKALGLEEISSELHSAGGCEMTTALRGYLSCASSVWKPRETGCEKSSLKYLKTETY